MNLFNAMIKLQVKRCLLPAAVQCVHERQLHEFPLRRRERSALQRRLHDGRSGAAGRRLRDSTGRRFRDGRRWRVFHRHFTSVSASAGLHQCHRRRPTVPVGIGC